jgi:formylmethanofuran dehydrogenase subunit E
MEDLKAKCSLCGESFNSKEMSFARSSKGMLCANCMQKEKARQNIQKNLGKYPG